MIIFAEKSMQKRNILLIDKIHDTFRNIMLRHGWECDDASGKSQADIERMVGEYFGVVSRAKFAIERSFIDQAFSLRFIARPGSGMENIDVEYAAKKGILCINSPEGNRDALGEHAVGMLLCLMNKIHSSHQQICNHVWQREANRGVELGGKTIGIIGYGNMGSAFARRLRGFDVKILAYDKYKTGFSDEYVREACIEEIFDDTDVFSIHLPLTAETHFLFNDHYLSCFKKDVFLLNTSRGQIVNTATVVSGLKSGKIRGAALDVIEYEKTDYSLPFDEPLPSSLEFLLQSPDVILTPHIAGYSEESKVKLAQVLAEKIIRAFP